MRQIELEKMYGDGRGPRRDMEKDIAGGKGVHQLKREADEAAAEYQKLEGRREEILDAVRKAVEARRPEIRDMSKQARLQRFDRMMREKFGVKWAKPDFAGADQDSGTARGLDSGDGSAVLCSAADRQNRPPVPCKRTD